MIYNLFRYFNYFNPSSRGRLFLTELASRLGVIPDDGVFDIESGLKMELSMKDFVERSIFFYSYEFLCTRIIMAHLKPGGVFIDIGANVGYYAIKAFHRLGPKGRVIAIEPNPDVALRLKRNMYLSGADGIELHEVAVADSDGEVTLFSPRDQTHGLASMRIRGGPTGSSIRFRLDGSTSLSRMICRYPTFSKSMWKERNSSSSEERPTPSASIVPPIFMELNWRAAEKFGYEPLAAVQVLFDYYPDYRLHLVMNHGMTESSLEELKLRKIASANLLLEP